MSEEQNQSKYRLYLRAKILVLATIFSVFVFDYFIGILIWPVFFAVSAATAFTFFTWLAVKLSLRWIDRLPLLVHLALLSDLVVVVLGIYLAGGPENPWVFLPMIVVVMAGFLFGLQAALAYALASFALISLMFGLEYFSLVPHYELFNSAYAYWKTFNYQIDYLLGMLVLYFLSAAVTGSYYLAVERTDSELRATAEQAVKARQEAEGTKAQLVAARSGLEERVRERTRELETAQTNLEKNVEERTKALEEARRATLHILKDLKEDMVKLEAVDRMKTEFLSMVSHELRTPLTPIKAYLTLILSGKMGEVSAQQKEALAVVSRQGNHLQDLIESLLDLSRLELNKPIPIVKEPLALSKFMDEIIEAFKVQAEAKQLDFRLVMSEKLPTIMADGIKLKRVISNLIGNSIKFTPKGGAIVVSVGPEPAGGVRFEVSDNGIGIPADQLEKIFEKFYQIEGPYTQVAGGIGMGLAIARELVGLHGGRIWAESAGPGKGAKFVVVLPVEGGEEKNG